MNIRNILDDSGNATLDSPLSNASTDGLATPRLEVSEIDTLPFSADFNQLFEGLGLRAESEDKTIQYQDSPDISYSIENITNLKDIAPEWEHDDIDEIVVMSSRRPVSAILPTIQEACAEIASVPSALLSEFSFEPISPRDLEEQTAVFRPCVRRDTGISYIMKVTKAFTVSASREQAILETLAELRVQFVPQAKWILQEADLLYVVNGNHPNGDLFDYIKQNGALGHTRTTFYASELVVALSSLHSVGIVHRAVSPSSISFDSQGHLLLSNFDHADLISSTESHVSANSGWNPYPYMPPEYCAPEMVLGWSHDAAVDCWSFGMTVYFMFFGCHPFAKVDGPLEHVSWIYDQILRTTLSTDALRLVSSSARELVLQCLERNPSVRCTIEEVKAHSYFKLTDWEKVLSKRLEVPHTSAVAKSRSVHSLIEQHNTRVSLCDPSQEPEPRRSVSSIREASCIDSLGVLSTVALSPQSSQVFKRRSGRIGVPSIVHEEEEPVSDAGHLTHSKAFDISRSDQITDFWDKLDKEEMASIVSTPSQEFGQVSTGAPQKPHKLRKHRSSIHPRHRLFNISTTSFQMKLRRKPRSTSALREPNTQSMAKEAEKIDSLPLGIHQMGSGIGFTYNLPSQAPSKLSVCSFAPPCGAGLFSVKGFGRGFAHSITSSRRAKASKVSVDEPDDDPVIDIAPLQAKPTDDLETLNNQVPDEQARRLPSKDASNGCFLRDMCHTPSWILSPPDSIPSPIVPTNSPMATLASPFIEAEPLTPVTPATLVEAIAPVVCFGEEKVIALQGGAEKTLLNLSGNTYGDLDPTMSPDSTLRLVPPSKSALRLSFISMDAADESVF